MGEEARAERPARGRSRRVEEEQDAVVRAGLLARAERAEKRLLEVQAALAVAHRDRRRVETELGARLARAEARNLELARRVSSASRVAEVAQAGRLRSQELEAALAAAGQARARAEKKLDDRIAAAEARAAHAKSRLDRVAADRRHVELRAARVVAEAETRFGEELGRRDALRAHELRRLLVSFQQLQASLRQRAGKDPLDALEIVLVGVDGSPATAVELGAAAGADNAPGGVAPSVGVPAEEVPGGRATSQSGNTEHPR